MTKEQRKDIKEALKLLDSFMQAEFDTKGSVDYRVGFAIADIKRVLKEAE